MNTANFMPEKDLMYTILADLKRTVREYVTAATESNCPIVRQIFTDLTNSTLQMQGDLYKLMQQQNMYDLPASALRQTVNQELQKNQQMEKQCQQFVQEKLAQAGHMAHAEQQQSVNGIGSYQQSQGH